MGYGEKTKVTEVTNVMSSYKREWEGARLRRRALSASCSCRSARRKPCRRGLPAQYFGVLGHPDSTSTGVGLTRRPTRISARKW